ncbi:MAG: TetR/AcrR family transcriptional regulator [Clostridia bacterium]|nr:TetR/AcrR family transcriptional regulator [Clostridia bacterium]
MGNTMREKLMQGAIHVVAEDGLENTTTKKVAMLAGTSEITLFRLFKSKNNMLLQTFAYVDNEFGRKILSALPILTEAGMRYEIRYRLFFVSCWKYFMEHLEQSQFYLRFYHSSYFAVYAEERKKTRQRSLIERVKSKLRKLPNDEDTEILLIQLLDTILNFASRVARGEFSDNDETAEIVFQLWFNMIEVHHRRIC